MTNKNLIIKALLFLIFFVVLTLDCYAGTCTDSDGGKNYYTKGSCVSGISGKTFTDYCTTNKEVKEFYCNPSVDQGCWNIGYSRTGYICENGKLVEAAKCTDTDGGKDYYTKGTATSSTGAVRTDYCTSATTVKEFYCGSDQLVYNTEYSRTGYVCEGGKLKYCPKECDGECCGDDTSWQCQSGTGNLIKEKAECWPSGCAYDKQNCGECKSNNICSVTGCECDYECNLIAPGCSSSWLFCTELSSTSCGYVNCNYCSEGLVCRVKDGTAGCYPEEGTSDQTCAEQGGNICSSDEVCGDDAWGYEGIWLSATDTMFCCDSSCHIPTYSGGCPSGCSCTLGCDGIWLYDTGQVCDYYKGGTGTCWCQSPASSNCGNEKCDTDLGENCENCPKDCGCISPKVCVNGACVDGGVSCTSCSSWVSQTCGGWTCNDNQMYQTRTCTPSGCSSTRRCVSSSSCADTSVCVPGETDTQQCGETNVGECSYGTQTRTCNSQGQWGSYGSCVGAVYPTTEICDGKDNDCDGSIDEGVTQPCYNGPAGTKDVGICHGGTQTCSAGLWGSCVGEVTPQEEIYDNLDNDCDGYVDECVAGTVTNVSLELIKGAEIKILSLDKSYTTDANGNYFICEFPQGIYDIVASKKGFDPVNKQFTFDATNFITINFVLYTAGSDCKPDCSKTTDPEKPRCHADCDGINGCKFYDERTKEACTTPIDRVVGVTESYNETHKLTCCEGVPYLYKKIKGTSLVFPEAENIVRITRIVFFRGQFARMIIDVFE